LIFTTNVNAQESLTVISNKGLNLRKSPTKEADIVRRISFLDSVNVLANSTSYPDTTGSCEFYAQDGQHYRNYIRGKWIKVSYKGAEGWAFDAYLTKLSKKKSRDYPNLNESFGFSFVGSDCSSNIHDNQNIQWKGVFENKGKYYMKNIEVTYFQTPGLYDYDICTTAQDNEGLLFIVGADSDVFAEGEITGTYYDTGKGKIQGQASTTPYDEEILTNFDFLKIKRLDTDRTKLILAVGQLTQEFETDAISKGPESLIWKGDLDKDGKEDYIIAYGFKSSATILYLSSQAKEGEIVKPVAVYETGFCC